MSTPPIGRIAWPAEPAAACRHYLGFAVQVVEPLRVDFPSTLPDPIASARRFIDGILTEPDSREQMVKWWEYIDTVGGVREFRRREALVARLALCLFAFPSDAEELGELVSWLFQVLAMLGIDTAPAERLRGTYFTYR
jgi:hypothetical protein